MAGAYLTHLWYPGPGNEPGRAARIVLLLLIPLSWLFGLIVRSRRWLYRAGVLPTLRVPVPVWVVGNLTVGGTGKTPMVIWLIEFLRRQGRNPGVVSRGYGGSPGPHPLVLTDETAAVRCGDEPRLIRLRTGVPVAVHPDRVGACEALIEAHPEVDIILSDDGLQHLRMGRDREIVVVHGGRGLGNRRLLPAGPLREPAAMLHRADLVMANGGPPRPDMHRTQLVPRALVQLSDGRRMAPEELSGRAVRAVAGIGDPVRFFRTLEALGAEVDGTALADHAPIPTAMLDTPGDRMLILTEKDAARLPERPGPGIWTLQMDLQLDRSSRASVERELADWLEGPRDA